LRGKFLTVIALGIGVSILSLPLFAHHGNAAYDAGKSVSLKGTVTQWFWANPHCVLQLDVTDDRGQVVQWNAETENPSSMIHYGWTKQSLKPGDQVTVTVLPVKNGKPIGRIVEVVLPSGQKLAGRALQVLESSKPEDYPKQ
jgi:hypothetical protein